MRQRKVKNLEEKLEAVGRFLVEEPEPEIWDEVFDRAEHGLYVEIGCGRGDFILQQALLHPENDYIGIEGQASVVLRAMEKAARIESGRAEASDPEWMREAARLPNLRFVCAFVSEMSQMFSPGSLSGVYLNFSDPWPKERHAKRRLTWRGRLQDYAAALRPGGFIAVKTDNDGLFEFTLEEIAACGWTPAEITRDLHGVGGRRADSQSAGPQYEARRIMTEYEQKFHRAGKPIHYVKVIV